MPKNEGIESEKKLMQHIDTCEKIAKSIYVNFDNILYESALMYKWKVGSIRKYFSVVLKSVSNGMN